MQSGARGRLDQGPVFRPGKRPHRRRHGLRRCLRGDELLARRRDLGPLETLEFPGGVTTFLLEHRLVRLA